MNSLEVHSTPNVGQDDKIMNVTKTNESNNTDDSGIQTTPKSNRENKNNNNEVSFIDENVAAQSTPSTTRTKELSMDDLFNLIITMSENINRNVNAKFKEEIGGKQINYLDLNIEIKDNEKSDFILIKNHCNFFVFCIYFVYCVTCTSLPILNYLSIHPSTHPLIASQY